MRRNLLVFKNGEFGSIKCEIETEFDTFCIGELGFQINIEMLKLCCFIMKIESEQLYFDLDFNDDMMYKIIKEIFD